MYQGSESYHQYKRRLSQIPATPDQYAEIDVLKINQPWAAMVPVPELNYFDAESLIGKLKGLGKAWPRKHWRQDLDNQLEIVKQLKLNLK